MSRIANTCINYEETRDDRHLSTMLESVRRESVGSMLYLRESQRLELEANQRQDDDHPRPNLPPPVRQLGRTIGRQRRNQQSHNRSQSSESGCNRSKEKRHALVETSSLYKLISLDWYIALCQKNNKLHFLVHEHLLLQHIPILGLVPTYLLLQQNKILGLV